MNGGWWLGAGGQAGGGTGWGPRGPARAAAAQDFSRGGGWDTPPPTPCAGQRGSEEGSGGGQRRLRGRGGPAATLGRRRGGGGASPVGPAERPLGGSPRDPPPHPPARNRGGAEGVGLAHPPIFNTLRCVPRRSTRSAAGSPATVADEAAKRPGHWGISVAYLSEDKRGKNVTGVRLFILPAAVISPNVGMGQGEGASGGRTAFDDQLTVGSLPPPCAMYLGRRWRGLPASESR